jgi:hypothetical protein
MDEQDTQPKDKVIATFEHGGWTYRIIERTTFGHTHGVIRREDGQWRGWADTVNQAIEKLIRQEAIVAKERRPFSSSLEPAREEQGFLL